MEYCDIKSEKKNRVVVLIHGMGRSKLSMIGVGNFLKKNNFKVISFSYSSIKYNIDELSAQFADFLIETSKENQNSKINILSHSLGGIISRVAVDTLNNPTSNVNFGQLIMLAPPNGGSKAANIMSKIWPVSKILKPISELKNHKNSPIHNIPIPTNIEIGVIAGKFDKKVSIEESHIKNEKDHITVNSAHTFIMNNKNCRKAILNFYNHSKF